MTASYDSSPRCFNRRCVARLLRNADGFGSNERTNNVFRYKSEPEKSLKEESQSNGLGTSGGPQTMGLSH